MIHFLSGYPLERIMEIIIQVVIGWKDGKKVSGIIRVPLVIVMRVEEQTRSSLHAHICVCSRYLKAPKQCHRVPKFAISNGLDIGCIPLHGDNEINAVFALLLARIRVVFYIFKYMSKDWIMWVDNIISAGEENLFTLTLTNAEVEVYICDNLIGRSSK